MITETTEECRWVQLQSDNPGRGEIKVNLRQMGQSRSQGFQINVATLRKFLLNDSWLINRRFHLQSPPDHPHFQLLLDPIDFNSQPVDDTLAVCQQETLEIFRIPLKTTLDEGRKRFLDASQKIKLPTHVVFITRPQSLQIRPSDVAAVKL